MRCDHCGSEWTTRVKVKFRECPFCGKALNRGVGHQDKQQTENHLTDFDMIGTVLRGYSGTDPVVVIPEGITELGHTSLGKGAFEGNKHIKKVILPNSLIKIGDHSFTKCSSLQEVEFGNGLRTIGRAAFAECTAMIELALPEGLTEIRDGAFSSCLYLKKIVLPNSYTPMRDRWGDVGSLFGGCSMLSDVTYPAEKCSIEIFRNSHYYEIAYKNREKKMEDFRNKVSMGVCPECGGKIGVFFGRCKSCDRKYRA